MNELYWKIRWWYAELTLKQGFFLFMALLYALGQTLGPMRALEYQLSLVIMTWIHGAPCDEFGKTLTMCAGRVRQ